jgi:hypothetical protein
MAAKRLGTPPQDRSGPCSASEGCPDIFQIDTDEIDTDKSGGRGRVFAVVGTLALPDQVRALGLPEDGGVGPGEALVFLPEEVFLNAAAAVTDRLQTEPAAASSMTRFARPV